MCAFVCVCVVCVGCAVFGRGVELGGWLRLRSTQPRMLFLCVNDTSACHLLS